MVQTLYTQKDSNVRKTWLLVTTSLVLVIALGWFFSYLLQSTAILYFAIVFAIVTNLIAYWHSDKIALAMSGAHQLQRNDNVELFRIIENLSITAGLPMPRIYLIDSRQINAFATGRDAKHAAIAVTAGALAELNKNELEGVIAHELSHIGNRDILVSTIVVVLAGVIAILADWFFRISFFGGMRSRDDDRGGGNYMMLIGIIFAILAPLAATLIQLAVSRKREYLADASGALLTRYPEGLANALEKIRGDEVSLRMATNATAHLFISSPFKGKQGTSWLAKLFLTHPPLEDRIKILRNMELNQ
jgi:heat shock protein HtpX